MAAPNSEAQPRLHRGLVFIIAACAGVTVMNIYLAFPMITLFAASFGVPDAQAATIATISQVGYAIGLFLVIPLGDVVRRKRLLTVLIIGATLGLSIAALAPNIETLSVATFVLSGLTVAPHVLIPLLVSIVPETHRGRALAAVSAAMTTGIAASRVGAGVLGGFAGWQWTYVAAATLTAVVGLITILVIPREEKRPSMNYGRLLLSTLALLKTEPRVRWSIALQVPTFAVFNLVWSMMVLLLTGPPYNFSVAAAALFGLLGLASLFTARPAGWLLDMRGTGTVITWGIVILVVSTLILQFSLLGLWIVILGIILLTIGQQTIGIGNQTRTLTLRADARARLNTLYMTSNFIGGSMATGIATIVYAFAGWPGVTATALGVSLLAAAVFFIDEGRTRRRARAAA